MDKDRKCWSWPPHFSGHDFLSVDILSKVTAAYLFLYDRQFLAISFKWPYVVTEQRTTINKLSIASAPVPILWDMLSYQTFVYQIHSN